MHRRRARAFTLIEAMITVCILSIGASLAVPSLAGFANAYRSHEGARALLLTFGHARALSQKRNEAVRVMVLPDRVELARPSYGAVVATLHYVDGWITQEIRPLGSAVVTAVPTTSGSVSAGTSAVFFLCPTGDATFLTAQQQQPICPLGDMASNGGRLQFTVLGHAYSIHIAPALAHLRLARDT